MISALVYLRFTTLWNRLVSTLRRMRQPKYLVAALVGACYFYFLGMRRLGPLPPVAGLDARHPNPLSSLLSPLGFSPSLLGVAAGAILLSVFVAQTAFAWIAPPAAPGLSFSEAEIAFLFPAPLRRRKLVHFNLLSTQLAILLTSLFITLLTNRWSFLGGNALTHAVGWWVIFSANGLIWRGMSLLAAADPVSGPKPLWQRGLALGLAVGGAAMLAAGIRRWMAAPGNGAGFIAALDQGLLHWMMVPFMWIAGPFLAPDWRAFFTSMAPAAAILGLLYWRVSTLAVSFEEGSIAMAEKRTQWRAAAQAGTGGRRAWSLRPPKVHRDPFSLRGSGRPELAFFWKNLIAVRSWFSLRMMATLLALVLLLASNTLNRTHGSVQSVLPEFVFLCSAAVAGYTLFLGPQLVRQDLRNDLANADVIKLYPLAGWQVVAGEIMAPATILSGILWLALFAAAWAVGKTNIDPEVLTPAFRVSAVACIGLIVPFIATLQLVVPNAATLFFPAWSHSMSRGRAAGVEVFGQRLIFVFGQLLLVVIALLPAALTAFLLVAATSWFLGMPGALLLATLAVLLIVGGEIAVGIWWLGQRFEKLDVATELAGN